MADDVYDRAFYDITSTTAAAAARRVVPAVVRWLQPATVIDVGCGEGAWLAEFISAGCTGLGLDREAVDQRRLRVPSTAFQAHDLEQPITPLFIGVRFDLCVCLELAEHLSPARADSLIEDLAALSHRVLFSAATPGQGGYGHVNEQPHEYWVRRFEDRGYAATRLVRRWFADDEEVASWYQQNLLLLVQVAPEGHGARHDGE